jgi:single-stranded DNA-binding protein
VAVDGKLVRRSFVNKEGKNIFVTEIVIDAINSLGSKKDSNSGLSFNTKPTKQSIDDAFPENVVKQTSGNQEHKTEPVKHEAQENVE